MIKYLTDNYNYILYTALTAWITAQLLKFIIHFFKTGKYSVERIFGAGGMPSSHSALVCSTTVAVFRECGFSSVEFALAFILAMIVMYDAMGVRRAAGNHAREINKIVKDLISRKEIGYQNDKFKDLKEFLGHTPLEVCGGMILGVLIAFIIPMG